MTTSCKLKYKYTLDIQITLVDKRNLSIKNIELHLGN